MDRQQLLINILIQQRNSALDALADAQVEVMVLNNKVHQLQEENDKALLSDD